MKTQNEISLLADQELDAVVGGRMNNGIGQRDANPPGHAGSTGTKIAEATVGIGGAFVLIGLLASL